MKPFVSITVPADTARALVAMAERADIPPLMGTPVVVSKFMPKGFLGYTHADGSMTIVGPLAAREET